MNVTLLVFALAVQQPQDTVVLKPVVVTATRVPVAADLVASAVTVLRGVDLVAQGVDGLPVLAAHRAGVRVVVLPKRNEKNLIEDVPKAVREAMSFHLVESVTEAIEHALGAWDHAQKAGAEL